MNRRALLKIGVAGSAVTALCCFTPVLVLALGTLGLSAWMGWLDYLLLPVLGLFAALTGYALMLKRP